MKVNSLVYPYPILSSFNNDYVNSKFDVEYKILKKGFNTRALNIKFFLEDKVLEEMIENNIAKFAVHIECPIVSYRKLYMLNRGQKEIELPIDTNKLRKSIEVNSFLVLNKDLDTYCNKNFNRQIYGKDYKVYNLKKGSILATLFTETINIKTSGNDFESLPSVVKVAEGRGTFMELDIDGDYILIKLPKKTYRQYVNLSQGVYSDILLTSIMYPAITYVLEQIADKEKRLMYLELNWYRVIEKKLKENDILIEDINQRHSSLEISQMILESPLDRGIQSIEDELERIG